MTNFESENLSEQTIASEKPSRLSHVIGFTVCAAVTALSMGYIPGCSEEQAPKETSGTETFVPLPNGIEITDASGRSVIIGK